LNKAQLKTVGKMWLKIEHDIYIYIELSCANEENRVSNFFCFCIVCFGYPFASK